AAKVHKRTTTVARINRGISLKEVLQLEIFVAQIEVVPPFRADDAARHALAQPERAADGEHKVADLEFVAIAKLGRLQAAGIDSQHRNVGFAITPKLLRM